MRSICVIRGTGPRLREILPESVAVVHLGDSTIRYGDSLFEMTRTFNRRRFALGAHVERLRAGMRAVEMPVEILKDLDDALAQLDAANAETWAADDEIREVIQVGRGLLPIYSDLGLVDEPWLMIWQYPLRRVVRPELYNTGVSAWLSSQHAFCWPAYLKHSNRLHFRLAEIEAHALEPGAWALLRDDADRLAEATGANLFIVRDGVVQTPPTTHCLAGISRSYVLDLCRRLGIPESVRSVPRQMVESASEAFFTCTPYSIVPWTRFNGKQISIGPGPITKRLTRAWALDVLCNFDLQALTWRGEE